MMPPSQNCGGGLSIFGSFGNTQQDCGRVCLFSIFASMEQKLLDLEWLLSLEAKLFKQSFHNWVQQEL